MKVGQNKGILKWQCPHVSTVLSQKWQHVMFDGMEQQYHIGWPALFGLKRKFFCLLIATATGTRGASAF